MILPIQAFILSGKAKYGSPSTIITIPITLKKNSIGFFSPTSPTRLKFGTVLFYNEIKEFFDKVFMRSNFYL